jgi:HSP20 family molecular chaperone IbpA
VCDGNAAYVRDGSYVVRAELPGIDPEKDLEVTVSGGILNGILEITVALTDGRGEHAGRKIPVRVNHHVRPT